MEQIHLFHRRTAIQQRKIQKHPDTSEKSKNIQQKKLDKFRQK